MPKRSSPPYPQKYLQGLILHGQEGLELPQKSPPVVFHNLPLPSTAPGSEAERLVQRTVSLGDALSYSLGASLELQTEETISAF